MRSSSIQPAVLLSALAASLVALPGSLVAQETSATKSGKYFVVTCEGGDEHTAALAVVEPVWSLTCATFGVREAKPKKLLSVVLYRDVDGYLKADRRLTGGKFQPNQAMSHWGTKSAHVAMQPPVNDGYIKKFGLPKQTQAMLAWEACHIARFELCRNFRVHPRLVSGWSGGGCLARRVDEAASGDGGAAVLHAEMVAGAALGREQQAADHRAATE